MRRSILFLVCASAASSFAAAPPKAALEPVAIGRVKLLPSAFLDRANLNRDYVASLKTENLMQNFYLEAGMWSPQFRMNNPESVRRAEDIHWGWESPTCQLRGHFLGHWLSAAEYIAASTGDPEVKGKADRVVAELARVQKANGGQWAASIPEKYLEWVVQGKPVWAPHYTIHKTFMGLVDAYKIGHNEQALSIANNFAAWFAEWTRKFTREQMDDTLDVETGGMLEVWSDLYGITGKPAYLELMQKYRRGRLFDRLLAGEDALTNKHANTTIPEAQGAARAYEVTGDAKWRAVVEAYWDQAVTKRGMYATGGQTSGEIWTPPQKLSARLGDKNQEHCVVYNMIRLADYLYRWTGDVKYADYIERNIYNGVLAQQNPVTGMVTYFLPLGAGSKKTWGTPTNDFWCCHGSLVQAQSRYDRFIYYTGAEGVTVAQYIPSEATFDAAGSTVRLIQTTEREADDHRLHRGTDPQDRPNHWIIDFHVVSDKPAEFALKLRIPWWIKGRPVLTVDGAEQQLDMRPSTLATVRRVWKDNRVRLILPKGLTVAPLPDRPDMVAFLDGPVVLAGLTDTETALRGNVNAPETLLTPDDEREWSVWLGGYRTVGQDRDVRFLPLNSIVDEKYTVYFPVRSN